MLSHGTCCVGTIDLECRGWAHSEDTHTPCKLLCAESARLATQRRAGSLSHSLACAFEALAACDRGSLRRFQALGPLLHLKRLQTKCGTLQSPCIDSSRF